MKNLKEKSEVKEKVSNIEANEKKDEKATEVNVTSKSSRTNINKSLIISAVIAGVVFVALIIAAIVLLGDKDDGIDIPDNFEKYEDENLSIGYPQDLFAEELFGTVLISDQQFSDEIFDFEQPSTYLAILSMGKESDIEEEDSLEIDKVKKGKCEDLADQIEEQDSGFEVSESEAVEINEVKACRFSMNSDENEQINYLLVDEDDMVYTMSVFSNGENQSLYEDLQKAARTFKVKSED